jgi:arabinose-5-phosphate isomerase
MAARPSASPPPPADGLALARRVLETEAAAILGLVDSLDHRFERVVELLIGCRGRVIVTGIGKSGIICRKVAATLASTGTPAFFLHPAEAVHGDLGVIHAEDVVIALSHSGETQEVLRVVEAIKRIGATLVAMTGTPGSSLGQTADVVLDTHVSEEACPLNLAPTASTTAALALGDALAMTLLVRRGFREEDFAHLHPRGSLGKGLMRAHQLMHSGEAMPRVGPDAGMREVLDEMSAKRLGMTTVVHPDGRLAGIITDGDLRRQLAAPGAVLEKRARDVMTTGPVTIGPLTLAVEALKRLEERRISSLVVIEDGLVAGVLHLHDLWRTELF